MVQSLLRSPEPGLERVELVGELRGELVAELRVPLAELRYLLEPALDIHREQTSASDSPFKNPSDGSWGVDGTLSRW